MKVPASPGRHKAQACAPGACRAIDRGHRIDQQKEFQPAGASRYLSGTPHKGGAGMYGIMERIELTAPPIATAVSRRPHVVVIGAGFGGLTAAMRLGRVDADVTVIDRRNYHLFQPLLYQVATAALSPADIAAPIRGILSRQANTTVILDTVTGIDMPGRAVVLSERRVPYEQLVIATGAREAYFGHDEWAAVTSGLKKIEDATIMRRRILIAFEHAEESDDEEERRRLLTFVIIGG